MTFFVQNLMGMVVRGLTADWRVTGFTGHASLKKWSRASEKPDCNPKLLFLLLLLHLVRKPFYILYICLAQVLAVSVPFAVVSFIKGVKLKTLLNDLMLHIESVKSGPG